MITITCNTRWIEEKNYILDVIFSEFLGLSYEVKLVEEYVGFSIELANGKSLVLSSVFWDKSPTNYLCESSLPKIIWVENSFFPVSTPILFGSNVMEQTDSSINCGYDIFASCFFMLSRFEEAIVTERDIHGRFPATASVAYKNDFLERPVVDEYVDALWLMLSSLDDSIERKRKQASVFVTCDVDWPYEPTRRSFKKTILSSVADVIIRKDIKLSLSRWRSFLVYQLNIDRSDTYRDNIDWIMDINERQGNKVAFYFISRKTSEYDSDFSIESAEMRALLSQIHQRGHEIGIHPGYECYNSNENFTKSVESLRRVLKQEGIDQKEIGGRMHYLRWDVLTTPQLWEKNDLSYDSSLAFADMAGFRCGTSKEYSMFDLVARRKLKLKQRPLISMECTIIASKYEGLGYTDKALSRFKYFKNASMQHNGSYTLLWHNNHFSNSEDKKIYSELIK